MSEKSRDELDREEVAETGEPDAAVEESAEEADEVATDGIDAPEELAGDDERGAETSVIVRKTAKAPVRKKDRPTPKREDAKDDEDPYKAKNPAHFARQSADELKRVVWPTWPQTLTMFGAVLVFVLIMIAIVGVLDLAFGWSLLKVFGS